MTGFKRPPGTNRPTSPMTARTMPSSKWSGQTGGKVPEDDVAEIAKWIADLIRDARQDGLWEA